MVNKRKILSIVCSSSYRLRILRELNKGLIRPRILEKNLKIKISHISRALKELMEHKLVSCISTKDTRTKIYIITNLGKQILKEAEKID